MQKSYSKYKTVSYLIIRYPDKSKGYHSSVFLSNLCL